MRKRVFVLIMTCSVVTACATTPPTTPPAQSRAAVDNDGAQHAAILAGSYWFRPDHLVVRAHRPVVLSVSKRPGWVPHSFVLKAPQAGMDIDVRLNNSEPKVVRFTPAHAGNYPYYCDEDSIFGSHRRKGMEGVLEVVN